MRSPLSPLRTWGLMSGVTAILVASCASAWSQTPPSVSNPSAEATSANTLAERLQAVEEMNRRLAEQLEQSTREHDEQIRRLYERFSEPSLSSVFEEEGTAFGEDDILADEIPTPVPDYTEGMLTPFEPAPGYLGSYTSKGGRKPLRASFGPGFLLETSDGQFSLQIHYESQIEGRIWSPSRNNPANNGFFFPRQRFFFTGHITKDVEYELSINRGVNNINLLNAYLNFHVDDRLEVRIGRFFTPFPYDQYAISNYWLLTPERSLFTTNLSLNRQIGAMAWGYLFDKRVDYAVGAFNGSRNSFESLNNGVDLVAYLNTRLFQESDSLSWLRFLNLGTSFAYGQQDQAVSPATFRIGAGSPDTNIPSIATTPFLILNQGVIERGNRALGSVHLAYFYKSLSLISEWQYGYGGYASTSNPSSVSVPFSGYYVSSGYFLTGEQVERRTRVKPLRPFLPLKEDETRGPGAWEPVVRVSQLRIGNEIFNSGFADPNIWSNSATTTELGVNWYWNDYLKFYTFWLHGEFGDPVQFNPGQLQKSVDMFWMRCQLYF